MKIHQYMMLCAPVITQMAALEALKCSSEVEDMVATYNRRRRLKVRGLKEIGLGCFEPKGAFSAFPYIANTGLTSEEFAHRLLMAEKVVVIA